LRTISSKSFFSDPQRDLRLKRCGVRTIIIESGLFQSG